MQQRKQCLSAELSSLSRLLALGLNVHTGISKWNRNDLIESTVLGNLEIVLKWNWFLRPNPSHYSLFHPTECLCAGGDVITRRNMPPVGPVVVPAGQQEEAFDGRAVLVGHEVVEDRVN